MILRRSKQLSLLLRVTLLSAFTASPVVAQQSGDQPAKAPPAASDAAKPMPIQQPQPTTVPGRPDIPNAEVAKQLRNVAPLPFGTPADKLPLAQLKVPKG